MKTCHDVTLLLATALSAFSMHIQTRVIPSGSDLITLGGVGSSFIYDHPIIMRHSTE